jgi:murein DD-endopeptidase MepM/ murein hydrolase activator NlpD
MATTRITSTLAGFAGAAILAIASLVLIALAQGTTTATAAPSQTVAGSYAWPVKPFNRPHPVRANFGDPRTTFDGPPTEAGVLKSGGSFSFHFGIDIAVPDGTAVYPVHSGTVRTIGQGNVQVTGDGATTQYWHIVLAVRPNQHVTAYETVLGHVMKGYEHVHFTEIENGRPVNPLARGHLAPYGDVTKPHVSTISFRAGNTAQEVLPESVTGFVTPVARASDTPARSVPGIWNDLPVAPALLTWRIERAIDSRIVVRERAAFDVRKTIPDNRIFWNVYARGSRQNMSTFGKQRAWRTPGTYLYRLTRMPLDTRKIPNGIYRLVVTAADIRGNTGSLAQVFIIRNGQGK